MRRPIFKKKHTRVTRFLAEGTQLTQADRFALSSLRKQGSRSVRASVDSRFRGNDKWCYILVIERFAISYD